MQLTGRRICSQICLLPWASSPHCCAAQPSPPSVAVAFLHRLLLLKQIYAAYRPPSPISSAFLRRILASDAAGSLCRLEEAGDKGGQALQPLLRLPPTVGALTPTAWEALRSAVASRRTTPEAKEGTTEGTPATAALAPLPLPTTPTAPTFSWLTGP
jgi:hypothetical protein